LANETLNSAVSNLKMTRRRKTVLILSLVAGVALSTLIWFVSDIQRATRFHAEAGSIDCGTVTNYSGNGITSIQCAQSAREHGRPFLVVFTGHGIDEQISSALIVDAGGRGIELFHGSGMVNPPRNRVMKSDCYSPVQLVVESRSPYGFPRLHCAPWPPFQ